MSVPNIRRDERVWNYPDNAANVLDLSCASLRMLRELQPDLIIAVSVETVAVITGLSESTVWAKCDRRNIADFEEAFPRYRRYRGVRRTVWNLNEVQAYLRKMFEDDSGYLEKGSLSRQGDLSPASSIYGAKRGSK